MNMGSLKPGSNRADYSEIFQAYDAETSPQEGIDLTGATILVEVHRPNCTTAELSATNSDGVTLLDTTTGIWQLDFTATQMRALDPMTYDIGITIEDADGAVIQYLIGTFPVLGGIIA